MGYNRANLERLDLLTGLGTSTKTATGQGTGIDLQDYEITEIEEIKND